jgi:hypothetical protein
MFERRLGVVLAWALVAPGAAAQAERFGSRAAGGQEETRARERAEELLLREEAASGRRFDPTFRAQVRARLAGASSEELAAVEDRGWGLLPAPKKLGDTAADLVFTPVAHCRLADTRLAGGTLAVGALRHFLVAGTRGFETQGGNAGGCDVPFGPATAVFVNITAVAPGGAGRLRAWKYPDPSPPPPFKSVLNYAPIAGLDPANGLVLPLCDAADSSCSDDLTVAASDYPTHITLDVLGYYRNVVKAQYRSFSTYAYLPFGPAGPVPNGCSNAGGLDIEIDAPVAGMVVVRGIANYVLRHLQGQYNGVQAAIGTSATDCTGWGPSTRAEAHMGLPPSLPSITLYGWYTQLSPTQSFQVSAGRQRYYLNTVGQGLGPSSESGADLVNAFLEATFHPN